jgi:hypothetical protein
MNYRDAGNLGVDIFFGDYSEKRKKGFRPFVQRAVAATLYGIAATSLLAFGVQAAFPDLVLSTAGLLDYLVVSQSLPTAISAYTLGRFTVFDANADGRRPTAGFVGHASNWVFGDFSPDTQWSLRSFALRFGGLALYMIAASLAFGAVAGLFPDPAAKIVMPIMAFALYCTGRVCVHATRPSEPTRPEKRDENETPLELVI